MKINGFLISLAFIAGIVLEASIRLIPLHEAEERGLKDGYVEGVNRVCKQLHEEWDRYNSNTIHPIDFPGVCK